MVGDATSGVARGLAGRSADLADQTEKLEGQSEVVRGKGIGKYAQDRTQSPQERCCQGIVVK